MKTLLGTFFALLLTASLQAQCTPGANYADSTFGAWPDTTTNFPVGYPDFYYQTDLNFKVPNDAGDIDSAFTGSTIVNFTVDSVVGLPPITLQQIVEPNPFERGRLAATVLAQQEFV